MVPGPGLGRDRRVKFERGTVVLVALDPTVGREQRGLRPAIVVTDPQIAEDRRFPMLCVVPITGTPGRGALYPELAPAPDGLRKTSYALIDQLRTIDKRRIRRVSGKIAPRELEAVDDGLRLLLGL